MLIEKVRGELIDIWATRGAEADYPTLMDRMARAAIAVVLEALREPTEAMLSAGQIDHGSYAAMLAAFTRTALDAETEDKPC